MAARDAAGARRIARLKAPLDCSVARELKKLPEDS
jgi:hypothetical protein